MAEPFVKLHTWMAGMGLNPSEMIVFAVIHSFTERGDSYFGGIAGLMKWTGCSDRTVQIALKHLVQDGWVIAKRESRGRNASEYVSNPEKIAGLNPEESSPLPRRNFGVNPEESSPNKINNKININTPYSPPTRGTAQSGKSRRRKNRALDYMHDDQSYDRESLRARGISLGEEFYKDD